MKKMLIHLHDEPFKAIQNGTKDIEMRLYDEKRRTIKIGDELKFKNRTTGENLIATVTNLYLYDNFKQIYETFDKVRLGYKLDQMADYRDMEIYYPKAEQDKYGVVAIEIKLI